MSSDDKLIARANALNSPNYAPAPVVFDHGQGVWLTDTQGREYLDFVAGIAVCSLGHAHPRLTEQLHDQVDDLLHVSNMFYTAPQIGLMERLVERTFADRVFFCNSGTEANEAAFKLARRYQSRVVGNEDKTKILSMKSSFHGRTLASITATGQPKYHDGFAPLAPDYEYAPFNDPEGLRRAFDDRVGAVIVEPVQGEGGIRPAETQFLATLRELCDDHGALLIYDEVQTGVGRTGELFAYQGYDIAPDIMTLAKGLGGGVALGATLATDDVWKGWKKGSHASTFGGNPLATRAGATVLDVIDDQQLVDNARRRGRQLRAGLEQLADDFEPISEVRGAGLLMGAECGQAASEIVDRARDNGLLINTAGGDTLRFVPPLIVTEEHVDEALDRLRRALEAL